MIIFILTIIIMIILLLITGTALSLPTIGSQSDDWQKAAALFCSKQHRSKRASTWSRHRVGFANTSSRGGGRPLDEEAGSRPTRVWCEPGGSCDVWQARRVPVWPTCSPDTEPRRAGEMPEQISGPPQHPPPPPPRQDVKSKKQI